MNIFITGASGFIGRAFLGALRPLLAAGDTAFCLSRRPAAAPAPGEAWLTGDLENPGTFRQELLASDIVFHIAGEPELSASEDRAALNYTSTRALLSTLKESGRIKKFVYISSIAAAGRRPGPITGPMRSGESFPPDSAYGRSKRLAEGAVAAAGIPFTIFRPSFVYGPGMRPRSHINRFVSLAVRNSPLALLDFPGRLPLIHVEDLALALAGALAPGAPSGGTYSALTESRTAGEIFSLILTSLNGRTPPRLPLPKLNRLPAFLRSAVPAGALALLSDYFWTEDAAFRADFMKTAVPRRIEDSIRDVIDSNPDFRAQAKGRA